MDYESLDGNKPMDDGVPNGLSTKNRKIVGYWLAFLAFGCYFALSAGGITRLTESAMKMTDRNPFRWIPPFGHWEEEFENYKKFDEYPRLTEEDRESLTLSNFEFKWFLVYFHRMGGRFLFTAFFIPFIYFWLKGYFSATLKKRMFFVAILMASQIPIGWWMLNSGLHHELMANKKNPGVSQYRMAIHLIIPFFMFGVFFYSALSIFLKPQDHLNVSTINMKRLRCLGKVMIGMLLIGSAMGSFLTALDAAEPEYAREWIPDDLFVLTPFWRNFFENPVAVQFIHRYSGYITFVVLNITFLIGRKCLLPSRARYALYGIMAFGYFQLLLGITTLYFRDPAVLAWLHQNLAMVLFAFVVWFVHEIR